METPSAAAPTGGADLETLARVVGRIRTNIEKVIEGKADVVSSTIVDETTSGLPSMHFSMFVRMRPTTRANVSRSAPPVGAAAIGVSTSVPSAPDL